MLCTSVKPEVHTVAIFYLSRYIFGNNFLPAVCCFRRYKYEENAHTNNIKGSFGVYGPGAFVQYFDIHDRNATYTEMEALEVGSGFRIQVQVVGSPAGGPWGVVLLLLPLLLLLLLL